MSYFELAHSLGTSAKWVQKSRLWEVREALGSASKSFIPV